jgi:hypothetical protein
MTERILIVSHDSPLRIVTEAEAIGTLGPNEVGLPRLIEKLDTRHLKDDVEGGHWRSSHLYLRSEAARLRNSADSWGATQIRYMGIAEVPHVLALGAYLGDERLVEARDYDRDRNLWEWPSDAGTLATVTRNLPSETVAQPGAVALRVEISYPILDADVDAAIGKERLADIRIVPHGRTPAPGLARSREDVARIRQAVREALAAIASTRPDSDVIHLFVAAPVSVCLAIGQELRLRNGKDVQTYRYRSSGGACALTPAILLTSGDVNEQAAPLSPENIDRARQLRAIWQTALEEIREHAHALKVASGMDSQAWYSDLEPKALLQEIKPLSGLKPIWELIKDEDRVALDSSKEEFELCKHPREWRLSDELVLGMFAAAGNEEPRMLEFARLFFWHEYVHDWQGLTAYTSVDVGRLANCLERIDYQADAYAQFHQLDFLWRRQTDASPYYRKHLDALVDQVGVALSSFWAFEPKPPITEIQERRLRRYLNWYWRRVQLRESPNFRTALALLARQPCIEISGLRRRIGGGRVYVVLHEPGGFERLHVGVVLEDGRLQRLGSSTDVSIEELLRAFTTHDREAIDRFFNALFEHVKQTGGAFPEAAANASA